MNTFKNKIISHKETAKLTLFISFMSLLLTSVFFKVFPVVYAGGTPDAGSSQTNAITSDVVGMLVGILIIICAVVGIIFTVVGIVKFAIAHANEDGPAQQKAIMMIATGIVLLVLSGSLLTMKGKVAEWITKATENALK